MEVQQPQASCSKNITGTANFDLGDTFNLSDWDPETEEKREEVAGGGGGAGGIGEVPLTLQLQQNYNSLRSAAVTPGDRHQPQFVLPAGQFDVLLCVDNTETAGGGAGGRKTLKEETVRHLRDCNVPYDRRNLNLGDFLWVARERCGQVEGQYQQRSPRELVLPFIIERKRLDDLWQSVKDGRYEEQKYRMKNCGLSHLYYLVEEYNVKEQFWARAGPGGRGLVNRDTIEQAVANTATQEGFTVKRTEDQRETIEYLTLITRLLTKKYQGRTLTSCSQADIDEGLVGNRDTTLLTFQDFNDSTKKNKELRVGDVWAKMLLRLKGLSVEMAQAITGHYPTASSLVQAYSTCSSEQEKVRLLSDLTYGMENKRKIPKTVAEALMKVWSSPTF